MLTIIREFTEGKYKYYECKCECWKITNVTKYNYWKQKTCWCLRVKNWKEFSYLNFNNRTHWMSRTKLYDIFKQIKQRTDNINCKTYPLYWWRWIKCEWNSFEEFITDMWLSYEHWLSLNRIDNNWNYCKDNCQWSTQKQQMRNTRRNVLYKWKCLTDWCEELNINRSSVFNRMKRWWNIEKALFTNIRKKWMK